MRHIIIILTATRSARMTECEDSLTGARIVFYDMVDSAGGAYLSVMDAVRYTETGVGTNVFAQLISPNSSVFGGAAIIACDTHFKIQYSQNP